MTGEEAGEVPSQALFSEGPAKAALNGRQLSRPTMFGEQYFNDASPVEKPPSSQELIGF